MKALFLLLAPLCFAQDQLQFASDVPAEQVAAIRADLDYLKPLRFGAQDPEALATLGLEELSGASLGVWLRERVRYIVAENFDASDASSMASSSFLYPNPFDTPILEVPPPAPPAAAKPRFTMAVNLGASLYFGGKISGFLFLTELPGLGTVEVRSPRVGIVQVGRGLFENVLTRFGWTARTGETAAGRLIRLGALFHEARHSDGNGQSLGFFHAVCPPGHDYAGRMVCDRSLNGAYAVGGLVERNLLKECQDCSVGEREALRLYTYDSFNRIIHVTRSQDARGLRNVPSTFLDATPEGKP